MTEISTAEDVAGDAGQSSAETMVNPLKRKAGKHTVITQFTIRKPEWSYIHFKLITPASLQASIDKKTSTSLQALDEVTCYMHLQAALGQFLGLYGTTIAFDILQVKDMEATIRTLRKDVHAVVAAAGGWAGAGGDGWRVVSWGCWGPTSGDGTDLFHGD